MQGISPLLNGLFYSGFSGVILGYCLDYGQTYVGCAGQSVFGHEGINIVCFGSLKCREVCLARILSRIECEPSFHIVCEVGSGLCIRYPLVDLHIRCGIIRIRIDVIHHIEAFCCVGSRILENVATSDDNGSESGVSGAVIDHDGRICAEFVMCYPPGIPILAPGERITEAIVSYILYAKEKGCSLTGSQDMTLSSLQVVQ